MFSSIPADAFQHVAREKFDKKTIKKRNRQKDEKEKKEKGRRCSQDFSDKMEQRRLGLQHRTCWKQEWLLRDQCLLLWWAKCQSPVSPRGRNPAWRGTDDGMGWHVQAAEDRARAWKRRPTILVGSDILVVSALPLPSILSFPSMFHPHFIPGFPGPGQQNYCHSGWSCQLLSRPAESHLLYQARHHRPICLFSTQVLSALWGAVTGKLLWFLLCVQSWMKAGKSLSPIPDWEAISAAEQGWR